MFEEQRVYGLAGITLPSLTVRQTSSDKYTRKLHTIEPYAPTFFVFCILLEVRYQNVSMNNSLIAGDVLDSHRIITSYHNALQCSSEMINERNHLALTRCEESASILSLNSIRFERTMENQKACECQYTLCPLVEYMHQYGKRPE